MKCKEMYFVGNDNSDLYNLYYEFCKLNPRSMGYGGSWSPRTGYGIDKDYLFSISVVFPIDRENEFLDLIKKYPSVRFNENIGVIEFEW